MFDSADTNKDGMVSFPELLGMFSAAPAAAAAAPVAAPVAALPVSDTIASPVATPPPPAAPATGIDSDSKAEPTPVEAAPPVPEDVAKATEVAKANLEAAKERGGVSIDQEEVVGAITETGVMGL
eukprot:FR736981.1.p1 GENE.FR736981.1~~FR736981.1.p1  ORF type:complete len:125 (+),score=18.93 FR736981.1:2-376(+)